MIWLNQHTTVAQHPGRLSVTVANPKSYSPPGWFLGEISQLSFLCQLHSSCLDPPLCNPLSMPSGILLTAQKITGINHANDCEGKVRPALTGRIRNVHDEHYTLWSRPSQGIWTNYYPDHIKNKQTNKQKQSWHCLHRKKLHQKTNSEITKNAKLSDNAH